MKKHLCRLRVLCAASALLLALAPAVVADQPDQKTPPPLSLESLFHPKVKFDYDGKLATARWVEDQPPKLIVRRKDVWMNVDLASGQEQPWPVASELQQQLSGLDGLDKDKLAATATRIAGQLKRSDEMVLAKIGKALAIVSAKSPARWLTRDASTWGNATLDPTARRVAFTHEGDLFLVDVGTGRTLRMTQDASETLLDGILDWTYQEEIYGRGNYKGFWFSPDGNWLAMLRIDISQIKPYVITKASTDRGDGVVRRYSKAGDPIPHAELFVWDLRQVDSGVVPPARSIDKSTTEQERIITGVWWHKHQMKLMYCISDRLQTWRELRFAGEPFLLGMTNKTVRLLREESPAWVEPPAAPSFLADDSVVWRSALPTGRSRLFWIRSDGVVVTPVSPQDFDVRDFFVRSDGSYAIVTGDSQRGTVGQQAYGIDLRKATDRIPDLIPITSGSGWHTVKISPDGAAIIDQHSSLTSPPSLSVLATTPPAKPIQLDQTTLSVPDELIKPKLFRITTPDKVDLPAVVYRPTVSSASDKVPVVIETYGGPQAAVVRDRWSGKAGLYRQLLAKRGVATLVVDNRSSAGRGIADTWSIQGKVGEVELKDLLSAVDWLKQQSWVDADRIAVRGWSFGGFLTLYAMTHSDAFAAGIAGGSVTDWREYDSFYTERYMGLPSANPEGYDSTAPVKSADKLHGRVLLIHGEVDDNVHPSGTLRMAKALQQAGKDFDLMIYPGAAHAIHDPGQVWHLNRMTDRFLLRQLGVPDSVDSPPSADAKPAAVAEKDPQEAVQSP